MDSLQAPADTEEASTASSEITAAALEAMVTPEQVLSANVARKRRTMAKRRPSRTREPTPARDVVLDTSEEEKPPPNVPERRRRKSKPASVERGEQVGEQNGLEANRKNSLVDVPTRKDSLVDEPKRKDSLVDEPKAKPSLVDEPKVKPSLVDEPKVKSSFVGEPKVKDSLVGEAKSRDSLVDDPKRKDSLVDITQAEVVALFNKAKRGIVSGRERIKQIKSGKSASKRSRSEPNQLADVEDLTKTPQEALSQPFTESQLLEGLRKAKLIDQPSLPEDDIYYKPQATTKERLNKSYRPVVQEYLKKRHAKPSPKVIEILDPKTSKVLKKITKGPPPPYIGFLGFLKLFFIFSPREIYRQYKAFKKANRSECQKIRTLRNRCIADLIIIMILCGLGGILFKNVEGAFENFYKCGVKRVKRDFIDVLWYRSHNLREEEWKSLARTKLRTFEEELHTAHEAGMRTYSGQRSWSFLNGVVYCLTVVTTIGYGHIYPTTNTGRALTIVYAIVGIPLFLIALTDFGKFFTRAIKFLWSFVRRLYYTGSCRKVRKTAHMEDILQGAQMVYEIATLRRPSMFNNAANPEMEGDPENPKKDENTSITIGTDTPTTPAPSNFEIDDEFNLPISVAIFILVLYIFLGALMYFTLEDQWGFFAAFYFVFISMSTIGFGDMVPENTLCMIASIVYLVFGLALMSMCINVVQVKLSDTFKGASEKLGATIGLTINEDDGSISTVTPAVVEMPGVHATPEEEEKKKEDDKSSLKKKSSLKARSSEEEKDEERKSTKEVKF